MASATKTPEYWISYLMTVIDNIPAKPDWSQIATETGAYKAGKFANQAYANLRKKYPPLINGNVGSASAPATPKSSKKRAAAADLDDDDAADAKPKSARKRRTPKKEAVKEEAIKEDVDDEVKANTVKAEASDDELNGDATIAGDDDDGEEV